MSKTYSELIKIDSFEERLAYLAENNRVGESKYGHDRYLNQAFYHSPEWRRLRRKIIVRDNGCDMAHPEYPVIGGKIIVHHLNEITAEDIENSSDKLFDPENLVCVSHQTHQMITYGLTAQAPPPHVERRKNDTIPWR